MTLIDPLLAELDAFASSGDAPLSPSLQIARLVTSYRELHDESMQLSIRMHKYEAAIPYTAKQVLETIDALVPESDAAYERDALIARYRERDRLLYDAGAAIATLARELAGCHEELKILRAKT